MLINIQSLVLFVLSHALKLIYFKKKSLSILLLIKGEIQKVINQKNILFAFQRYHSNVFIFHLFPSNCLSKIFCFMKSLQITEQKLST